MTKATLIYNAILLDETMNTPGAILIMDKQIRAVFQGYFTSKETADKLARSVIEEDGCSGNFSLDLYDAHGFTVTPSFIDMHVHMRYPGQTQKEDLQSGLKACAAGGFGTVVAMPNTKPVVSSYEMALQIEKEAAAIGLTHLFQTVSLTENFEGTTSMHLEKVQKEHVPVVSEDGRDVEFAALMDSAMKLAAEKNLVVSCHCEDFSMRDAAAWYRKKALEIINSGSLKNWESITDFENYLKYNDYSEETRTSVFQYLTVANQYLAKAEDIATVRNLMLAKEAGCRIHICHVSTENSVEAIRAAKYDYYDEEHVTCEVTPHHIALAGDEEPYIRALVNPPLRPEADRLALIEALRDGTIDVISTDHAPHTFEDKQGGSPGFTGAETAFAVCNTVLVQQNGFTLQKLSQLMSGKPAKILGLQKGLLKTEYDADLTIIDPEEEWTVDSKLFYSKGKATPFDGKTLTGTVKALFIDGRKVLERL